MYIHLTTNDIERFWKKVDRSGGPNSCWLWKAGALPAGYGLFWIPSIKKNVYAHRIALIIATGGYPDELFALHKCPGGDNPACCNPAHIYPGTPKQNMEDRAIRSWWRAPTGESNPRSLFTEEEAQAIVDECLAGSYGIQKQVADRLGVGAPVINAMVRGRTWKHLRRA